MEPCYENAGENRYPTEGWTARPMVCEGVSGAALPTRGLKAAPLVVFQHYPDGSYHWREGMISGCLRARYGGMGENLFQGLESLGLGQRFSGDPQAIFIVFQPT